MQAVYETEYFAIVDNSGRSLSRLIILAIRRPFIYMAKFVMPDGVSHKASHEKSNAFGSMISESRKLVSSNVGTGGTSTPVPCPFGGAMLVTSVSDGGAGSLEFKDAIRETGSVHLSRQ